MRLGKVIAHIAIVAVACASTVTADDKLSPSHSARREALSRIVVVDAVSRAEAEAIASYYFYDFVGIGCGGVGDIEDAGGSWRFPVKVGAAGARDGEILVDKARGSVKWHGGSVKWHDHPTVDDPLSMLGPAAAPSNLPLERSGAKSLNQDWNGRSAPAAQRPSR